MSADIFEDEDFQFSSKVTCFLSQDEMEAFCKQTATLAEVVNKDKDNDKDDTTPGPSHYLRLFFQYRTLLFQLQEAMDDLINLSLTLPLSTRGNNSSAQQIAQMMKALDAQDNAVEVENTRCLLESLQKVYSLSHALHAVLAEINACPESKTTTATAAPEQKQFITNSFLKSLMNIQQTSPARTFPLLPFQESVSYLQDMCHDLLCLCSTLHTMIFQTENLDLDTLLQWFLAFSRNKGNVLVRSYLVAVWTFLKPKTHSFLLNSCQNRGIVLCCVLCDVCNLTYRYLYPYMCIVSYLSTDRLCVCMEHIAWGVRNSLVLLFSCSLVLLFS